MRSRTPGYVRALALLSLAVWTSGTAGAEQPASEARPAPDAGHINVLLITVDTLRADHVGCYGHHLATSPTIDRLTAEGVRFADATVQWPKTWPSMATLLTSTYPATHGVRLKPRRPLPEASLTLAEILHAGGYRTAAVVANVNVGRGFSFDQGFDHFVESWVDALIRETGKATFQNAPGKVKRYTNATIVTDQAVQWLETAGKAERFFLWLHYMDPHGPYLPPDKYKDLFAGSYPPQRVDPRRLPQYQRQNDPRTNRRADDLGFYKAQYDREIRYFDDELARLLAELEQRKLRDHTLIVLTADHGESLGEHNYYLLHGRLPYQPSARVPLVMVLKDRLPAGKVVRAPVGLIDLMPTILELAGVPVPPTLQGTSLLPLLQDGEQAAPPYVFMEAGPYEPSQVAVRRGPWKLVHFRNPADRAAHGTREFELYHVWDDPLENHNLAAEHPTLVQELRTALDEWLKSTPPLEKLGERIDPQQLDESTRELLRSLGYLK